MAGRSMRRPAATAETASSAVVAAQGLAARIFAAFHRLGRAEARVIVAESRLLATLFDGGGHRKLGFARFGDLARERLGVSPRHADDRLALARTFANRPNVERAFREGRITACQVLALRTVFNDDNEVMWLALCPGMTVREIRDRVRALKEWAEPDESSDAPMASIAFPAPPAAVVAWDQAMETARRVIGANVPQYRCVEAVLAEVMPHLAPEEVDAAAPRVHPARFRSRASGEADGDDARPRTFANEDAMPRTFANGDTAPRTLADEDAMPRTFANGDTTPRTLADEDATPRTFANAGTGPHAVILSLRARRRIEITLEQIDRELQDVESLIETEGSEDPSHLIRRVRALQQVSRPLRLLTGRLLDRIHGALNDLDNISLAGFAERHLRVSGTTARGLLDEARIFESPALARAFVAGRIGVGQAVRLHRIAPADRIDAWIDRAESVTHRQFQRETRLLERLQDFFPGFAFRTPGPFPESSLEGRLRQALRDRGWSDGDIEGMLKEERGVDGAGSNTAQDPAENPALMRRLEILMEQLILTAFPVEAHLPGGPRTFANDGIAARIRFRAPAPIIGWWRAALRHLRAERGPLPAWACAMLLIRDATAEWEAGHRPSSGHAILRRDGYQCQVPGCSQRRDLQVHHVRFRSQGGPDTDDNRITLCFVHHQILLHEMGTVSVGGRAPDGLDWRLGPRGRLQGERWVPGCR